MRLPGDPSSAAAWLVAGALHPDAEVRLTGIGLNPTRVAIVEALQAMGAQIEVEPAESQGGEDGPEPVGSLTVRGGRQLRAIDIEGDLVADLIDELPLLGVAMAGALGTSELRDASELRHKESDRIALMVRDLAAIGAEVEELPDGWRLRRGRPRDAAIETAGDHRIAIAFAVAALAGVAAGVSLDDPACVDVSYPGFWDDIARVSA
jgi:3-phosphoshikimate 1-carboxyvinyltransferase